MQILNTHNSNPGLTKTCMRPSSTILPPPEKKLGLFKCGYENSSAIVMLIELDNILLVPPGKVGVLASPSTTIRARYRHIEYGFQRSICSLRPVDISISINPYWARFPEVDLFIEAGWHIKLDKLVSSSVAQIIKLIQLVNKPVPGKQTMLTYPFIFSRDWTLLQYRARHQF